MNKLMVIGFLGLLLVGSLFIAMDKIEEKTKDVEENVVIKNPATGEVWNSVEEYEFRELNFEEKVGGN
jgi:hypothetical protein